MSQSTLQLEYAQPPQRHRRRRLLRSLAVASLLIAGVYLAAVGRQWLIQKWERANLLYLQRQCMDYAAPPDEIVFDQVPLGQSSVLDGSPEYVQRLEYGYPGQTSTLAMKVPRCASQFLSLITGPWSKWQQPLVFMHERTAPSGHQYLIILHGMNPFGSWHGVGQLNLTDEAYDPGTWNDVPASVTSLDPVHELFPASAEVESLRLYAGQADPQEASHFTIAYEEAGRKGVIDGSVDDTVSGSGPTLTRSVRVTLRQRPAQKQ